MTEHAATTTEPDSPADLGSVADDDTAATYTIDELAALTGVASRTIRFWQTEGALPPPRREGRRAVYDAAHRDRLVLIAEMQHRGMRLAAIKSLLDDATRGRFSLDDWTRLGEALNAPWSDEEPREIDADTLDALLRGLPGRAGSEPDAVRDRLVADGVLRIVSDGPPPMYRFPSPGLARVALDLASAGVDVDVATGAETILRRHLHEAASELVKHFESRAGSGFGHGPEGIPEALRAIQPLSGEAVRLIFAQEMQRALRDYLPPTAFER